MADGLTQVPTEDTKNNNLKRHHDDIERESPAVLVPSHPPDLHYIQLKTGVVYDVRMRYHSRLNTKADEYLDPHPEDPRRTFRIYKSIAEAGLLTDETLQGGDKLGDLMLKLPSRKATTSELLLVHTQPHLDFIASTAGMSIEDLTKETNQGDSIYINNDSYLAAQLSCGGAIEACRGVAEGKVKNALAIVRPPGHHAGPETPSGFCLFSNVAVASRVTLRDFPEKVKKILVFDWDVHHGNGTQRCFYDDDQVLYISTHRYEGGYYYPGGGFGSVDSTGEGKGKGFSVNIPWSSKGMGDGDYFEAFHRIVLPIASEFQPDLVIISSGFDAADGDPIGECHVSPACYAYMTHMLKSLANGRLVVCLEGGYNLDSISVSAKAVAKVLVGEMPPPLTNTIASSSGRRVLAEVRRVQSRNWKSMGPLIPDTELPENQDIEPLYEIYRSFEARKLIRQLGFAELPMLQENQFIDVFPGQVLASEGIYHAPKVIVLFHDPAVTWGQRDPVSGQINPLESAMGNPAMIFIRWALENGYGVIDILSPLTVTTEIQELAAHVYDNTIKYFQADEILYVGMGLAYAGIVHLAGRRPLRSKRGVVLCFPDEAPLIQLNNAGDDALLNWFHSVSKVFVPSYNKVWEVPKQRKLRRRFGNVVRTDYPDLWKTVQGVFNECKDFIKEEVEDEEQELQSE